MAVTEATIPVVSISGRVCVPCAKNAETGTFLTSAAIVGGVVGGVLGVAALGALLIYLKRKHDNAAWTAGDGLSVYSGRSEKVGSSHMSQMGRSVAPSAMGGLAPPPPGTYYATDDTGTLHLVMGYASQESESLPPVPPSVGAESTLASPLGRPTAPPGTLPEPVSCPPLYPPKLCTDALLFRCRWTTGTKLRPSPRPCCPEVLPSATELRRPLGSTKLVPTLATRTEVTPPFSQSPSVRACSARKVSKTLPPFRRKGSRTMKCETGRLPNRTRVLEHLQGGRSYTGHCAEIMCSESVVKEERVAICTE